MGRFVVTRGQRQLSDRLGSVLHGMDDDDVGGSGVGGSGVGGSRVGGGSVDLGDRGAGDSSSGQPWGAGRERTTSPPRPEPSRQSPPDPAATAIVERALADYDTLSASQVVRRLESLGPDELRAVHRYEASTRNRRTILNRASQLLEEGPAAAAGE